MDKPNTWTEKGPGRKQCPSCGVYVGVRSNTCVGCQHVFQKKRTASKAAERAASPKDSTASSDGPREDTAASVSDRRENLFTPSGRCPVPLEETDSTAVRNWMERLVGLHPKQRLLKSCFRYWARSYFSIRSDEYMSVCDRIDSNMDVAA
jgi:hypothetical protein